MSPILVLNAGSSSLKFAVFEAASEGPRLIMRGQVAGLDGKARFSAENGEGAPLPAARLPDSLSLAGAQRLVIEWLEGRGIELDALAGAGHRIVHGGTFYVEPTLVSDAVQEQLESLRKLAPLHLPFGLDVLRRMRELAPGVPQVACFDTAFHASQPEVAVRLPLPARFHDKGYRRYGFHGLNYEHVVSELPRMSGKPLPRRLLVAHLGNGASMCAILDGRSVATTMGYSTADGLIMGTRTGALDPGVVIALLRDERLSLEEAEDLLYRQSGLKGLSGISGDVRELLADGSAEAETAIEHYCYSAARHAGSLLVTLGGIDGFAFTGGVGENAPPVRAKIAAYLGWLGVAVDAARNAMNAPVISPEDAPFPVWIVPAHEELTIARHTLALIGRGP